MKTGPLPRLELEKISSGIMLQYSFVQAQIRKKTTIYTLAHLIPILIVNVLVCGIRRIGSAVLHT